MDAVGRDMIATGRGILAAAEAKGYKAGLRKAAQEAEVASARAHGDKRAPSAAGWELQQLAARLRALAE